MKILSVATNTECVLAKREMFAVSLSIDMYEKKTGNRKKSLKVKVPSENIFLIYNWPTASDPGGWRDLRLPLVREVFL